MDFGKSPETIENVSKRLGKSKLHFLTDEDCYNLVLNAAKDIFMKRERILKKNNDVRKLSLKLHRLLNHQKRFEVGERIGSKGFDVRIKNEKTNELVIRAFAGCTQIISEIFLKNNTTTQVSTEKKESSNKNNSDNPNNVEKEEKRNLFENNLRSIRYIEKQGVNKDGFEMRGREEKQEYNENENEFTGKSFPSKVFDCPLKAGVYHGSVVHKQVEEFVKTCVQGVLCEGDLSSKVKKFIFDIHGSSFFDFCTLRIMERLCEMNFVPIETEYTIYDPTLCIASSIDLICIDESGGIVVVEMKTGYESANYLGLPATSLPAISNKIQSGNQDEVGNVVQARSDYMNEPLEFLPNCPYYLHMLQLLTYIIILNTHYFESKDNDCILRGFIFRARPRLNRCDTYEIPKEMVEKSFIQSFYRAMYEHQKKRDKIIESPVYQNKFKKVAQKILSQKRATVQFYQDRKKTCKSEKKNLGFGHLS